MEQILEVYGKLLLEALALVLLLLIFIGITDEEENQGVQNIIGANLDMDRSCDIEYTDFSIYQEESRKAVPVIRLMEHGAIHTGRWEILNLIKAFDWAGKEIPLRVISIRNPEGVEIMEQCNPKATEIAFDRPGIYGIKVSASDAVQKKAVCVIHVPVNQ